MAYRYPYGNTEQMNLDWFLNQWEKFKADWAEAEAGIDGSLDAEIAKVEAAMTELYAARDAAAASATAARQSSLDAAAAQVAAGNSKTAAQAAETSARGSQQAAAESAQEAQASATGAENSALTATQAANTATQQAAGADAAKGAAEAAQQAAEAAQAAAAQSAGQAGQAATAAGDHAGDAADSATLAQQAAQDMSDSVEQITTNKNDISDLKESVNQTEIAAYASFEQKTITDVPIASFDDGANGVPVKKLVVNIEPVQEGSGDPSPDNVRPITGWTGAKVTRTGKNLVGWPIGRTITSAGVTFTVKEDGGISCKGTSTGTTWGPGDSDQVLLKAGTYFVTLQGCENTRAVLVNDSISSSRAIYPNNNIFTLNEDALVHAYITGNKGITYDETVYFKLYLASENRDYEPYVSETYDITFPSEAGTVYGGKLEINEDGSGALTVDRGIIVDDGSEPWVFQNNVFVRYAPLYAKRSNNTSSDAYVIADRFKSGGVNYRDNCGDGNIIKVVGNNNQIACWSSAFSSADEFNASLAQNPMTVVCMLENTAEYTLTAQQITTLLGTNNIWADTGDIAELTYRAMNNTSAMVKLTKALIAPVLDSMVADTALVVNDFRIVGDTLYKVTEPIASGGTLTVGTNVAATTIGAQITALLNA